MNIKCLSPSGLIFSTFVLFTGVSIVVSKLVFFGRLM